MELGTGQALVSFLQADGSPAEVQPVAICPPETRLPPLTNDEVKEHLLEKFEEKYRKAVFDKTDRIMPRDRSMWEEHVEDLGRKMFRHAGYVFSNMLIRGLFHTFRGRLTS